MALVLVMVVIQRSPDQLHARIAECVSTVCLWIMGMIKVLIIVSLQLPADHWHCQDWHEKHLAYHQVLAISNLYCLVVLICSSLQKFPERYWPIVLQEMTRVAPPAGSIMPIYFGNICFALLPVSLHFCFACSQISG